MRYKGQGHELEVAFDAGMTSGALGQRFVTMHVRRYGFELPVPVEVVSARSVRSGDTRAVALSRQGGSAWRAGTGVDDGGVFDAKVRGRRVIGLPDATMLVPEGWTAMALPIGGWIMTRG